MAKKDIEKYKNHVSKVSELLRNGRNAEVNYMNNAIEAVSSVGGGSGTIGNVGFNDSHSIGYALTSDKADRSVLRAWAESPNSAAQLADAIMAGVEHPFAQVDPAVGGVFSSDSSAWFETLRSVVETNAENLTKELFADASVPNGTGTETGEGPLQALRVMRRLLPFMVVPTYVKTSVAECFTPMPFPKGSNQLIVPITQSYLINPNSGKRVALPQGYRIGKDQAYSDSPLLGGTMPLYQKFIFLADFDPDWTDIANPTSGKTEGLVKGCGGEPGFDLLGVIGTTTEVVGQSHHVDPKCLLAEVLLRVTDSLGEVTLEKVPIYCDLNSVNIGSYEFQAYGAADYDSTTNLPKPTAKLNVAKAHIEFDLKTDRLRVISLVAECPVIAISVKGNISSRMNTFSDMIVTEYTERTIVKGDGDNINAPFPIPANSEYSEIMGGNADYPKFIATQITRLFGDTITAKGLEHLELKLKLDNYHYRHAGILANLSTDFDVRPSATGPFAGSPTDWYGLLYREIEKPALEQISRELLISGKLVILAHIEDAALLNYGSTKVTPSGSMANLDLGYSVSVLTQASIKCLMIASPNFKKNQLMCVYRNDNPDFIRELYMPVELILKTDAQFRNPNGPNIPSMFGHVNVVYANLRTGGIFTKEITGNELEDGYYKA